MAQGIGDTLPNGNQGEKELDQIIAAAVLGLSFGNLWLCVLLVLSLSTTDRATCGGYLVGRAVAILILSLVIALLGKMVVIDKSWLNLISGLLLAGFSIYLILTRLFGKVPFWRRTREPQSECGDNCKNCTVKDYPAVHEKCHDCRDEKLCDAEEPELKELTSVARGQRGRPSGSNRKGGFWFGVSLGALRGAAVCAKLIVLLPLLLKASVPQALFMAIAFTLTSSLYPLLGFIVGSFAMRLVKYKRALVLGAALALLASGGFYLFKGVNGML